MVGAAYRIRSSISAGNLAELAKKEYETVQRYGSAPFSNVENLPGFSPGRLGGLRSRFHRFAQQRGGTVKSINDGIGLHFGKHQRRKELQTGWIDFRDAVA